MINRNRRWLKIWNKKGKNLKTKKLQDLINTNGFDSHIGKFNTKNWKKYIFSIEKKFKIRTGSLILEYGCGSGAFLFYFQKKKFDVYGIDYSKELIRKAKKIISPDFLKIGEYQKIKLFKKKFDIIISNSVFHYFKDLDYSKKVINEMSKNLSKNGKIIILDIPDINKKSRYFKDLNLKLGKKGLKKIISKKDHLFYSKLFFKKIGKKLKLKTIVADQQMRRYTNSKYRFNVCLYNKF